MSIAEVRIWDQRVGAIASDDGAITFEYDSRFVARRIEVSPITLPLGPGAHRFDPALFGGLPGLLSDSLPDRFGNALIDAWLATEGKSKSEFDLVDRLCYIGRRGMGALEFKPSKGPVGTKRHAIQIEDMVELSSSVLNERESFETSLEGSKEQAVKDLLSIGTSAGGARAKAVIAWNRETGQIRSGQVDAGPSFEHWLIKFDGVSDTREGDLSGPGGYGVREYGYALMARAAGINMSPSQILEEGDRRHFMTKRFDRKGNQKVHMQSLSALANLDFNLPTHAYEQALLVGRELEVEMSDLEQQFRRMVFNIVARNQDDHAKNIAFLMNRKGDWHLSPAFDLTYAYNPRGVHTSKHQMSVNGKRDGFTMKDLEACAASASLRRTLTREVVEDVTDAVSRWPEFAEKAGVPEETMDRIGKAHRLKFS
ncbi:MAG: type II toxin-antitoxin system HipA family toxin [Thermoleophilia bacterium]|nr:type II toxin-antitoxin system HipA family toxin [Thermoleophilia bacterium]